MQETLQGKPSYAVKYDYDEAKIHEIAVNSGGETVKDAANYLRALKYWSKDRFFVMFVDDVAFAAGAFCREHFNLAEIAVKESQQKQGYGRFMLNRIKAECARRGVGKIKFLVNPNSPAFIWYLRNGAQATKRKSKNEYEMEIVL